VSVRQSNKILRLIVASSWVFCLSDSNCMSAALVIQRAERVRTILLSSVACLALPYFATLPH
jgi:hypothetical protein